MNNLNYIYNNGDVEYVNMPKIKKGYFKPTFEHVEV
jgi:hypothetical protein